MICHILLRFRTRSLRERLDSFVFFSLGGTKKYIIKFCKKKTTTTTENAIAAIVVYKRITKNSPSHRVASHKTLKAIIIICIFAICITMSLCNDGEEEDLIEQLSRIDVTNVATFLSPTSSSMTLSSDADQPSKQDDPRDKLNQFLSSCNIPAVEKAWNDWNVVSDKRKKRYTKKVADIVSSVLYVLSPKDSALLWLSLIESPYMREVLGITDCPQSTKNFQILKC